LPLKEGRDQSGDCGPQAPTHHERGGAVPMLPETQRAVRPQPARLQQAGCSSRLRTDPPGALLQDPDPQQMCSPISLNLSNPAGSRPFASRVGRDDSLRLERTTAHRFRALVSGMLPLGWSLLCCYGFTCWSLVGGLAALLRKSRNWAGSVPGASSNGWLRAFAGWQRQAGCVGALGSAAARPGSDRAQRAEKCPLKHSVVAFRSEVHLSTRLFVRRLRESTRPCPEAPVAPHCRLAQAR